jgi:hypothetical protein
MRRIIAMTGAVLVLLLPTASATHLPNHQHSYGGDNTGTNYTALSTYRTEGEFLLSLSSNCSAPYTGLPVYQTMWLNFDNIGGNSGWIELGTGHQRGPSGYCRYRFWGTGINGVYHHRGWQTIASSGSLPATRTILGIPSPNYCSSVTRCWEYRVGGAVLGTVKWNVTGSNVEAGYETYDSAALAYSHAYESLLYKVNDGGWTSWSGQDLASVGTYLCGLWVFDDKWRAGENTTC